MLASGERPIPRDANEVAVIEGEKRSPFICRMRELLLVRNAESAGLMGADSIVTGGAKSAGQIWKNVFIQIEPSSHDPPKTILPFSCTEKP